MDKVQFKSGFGRVYPEPEPDPAHGAPLAGKNPPIAPEPEPESEPTAPPRLHLCRVLAFLWNVAFVSLIGAAIIYLIEYPLEAAEWFSNLPECALGLTIGFAMWGVTLVLHRCALRAAEE